MGKQKEQTVMARKLIIDGNAVYEIDEQCMLKKRLDPLEEEKFLRNEKGNLNLNQEQNGKWKESTCEIRRINEK